MIIGTMSSSILRLRVKTAVVNQTRMQLVRSHSNNANPTKSIDGYHVS
jgi:hypothetical protein